jgi:hypothetical protein
MFIFKLRYFLANPYGQNEKIFHLNQGFSIWVPRNPRVPQGQFWGSAGKLKK